MWSITLRPPKPSPAVAMVMRGGRAPRSSLRRRRLAASVTSSQSTVVTAPAMPAQFGVTATPVHGDAQLCYGQRLAGRGRQRGGCRVACRHLPGWRGIGISGGRVRDGTGRRLRSASQLAAPGTHQALSQARPGLLPSAARADGSAATLALPARCRCQGLKAASGVTLPADSERVRRRPLRTGFC